MVVSVAVNWTVVGAAAVTGVTAATVAFIGYFGTRLTASVTKRQIEAETERLLEQQREAHLQHRQGIYHDLLNAERQGQGVIFDPAAPQAKRQEALVTVAESVNGAVLFGTVEVGDLAFEFNNILMTYQEAIAANTEPPRGTEKKLTDARRRLIDAMRRDVAIDQRPLSWAKHDAQESKRAP